ncbi:MAG: ABC transporter permease [Treponema sp.]|nr:ABC transporter permease [Treponema sp.]
MKYKLLYRALKLVIVLLCAAGVVALAVYPFKNRDLTVTLVERGDKLISREDVPASRIVAGDCRTLTVPLKGTVLVSRLKIYGLSKTLLSKSLDAGSLARMIQGAEGGGWTWTGAGVELSAENGMTLFLSEEYSQIMREQSRTFLQERLIGAGYFICLMAILFIIVNVLEEKLSDTVKNNHSFLAEMRKFFTQLKKYKDYIIYSARADLNAEVANSYLNRLWWLLEPFFSMLVYVVVFGRLLGGTAQNYATFVFSALLMWRFFSATVSYSVKLVRNNAGILTKVYVPKFVILLSDMILNLLKLLFSMIVLVVMLAIFRVHIGLNILWVIPAYALMIFFSFGMGMILLHYGVYVDDLSYAVGILLTMLNFLSGTFYDVMTTIAAPLNTLLMVFNPVAVFTDVMRSALLSNAAVDLPLLGLWTIASLLLCYIGVHIVYANENSYVKLV